MCPTLGRMDLDRACGDVVLDDRHSPVQPRFVVLVGVEQDEVLGPQVRKLLGDVRAVTEAQDADAGGEGQCDGHEAEITAVPDLVRVREPNLPAEERLTAGSQGHPPALREAAMGRGWLADFEGCRARKRRDGGVGTAGTETSMSRWSTIRQ